MRFTQAEKYEIIRLVETSEIGVNRTLKEIGLHKSTFHNWYTKYREEGMDGLAPKPMARNTLLEPYPERGTCRDGRYGIGLPRGITKGNRL
ncbi:helix-turn-helix domain-containing protein [Flagellimonas onchidii]|uniref:helix-turn-helix domain-containing protein n=1 Tax=Flagellimonas onchidii TaxID=2562684 RepID=UPI0014560BEA